MRYRYGIIEELTKHPKHQKTKTYSDIITLDTESSNVGGYSCTYLWSVCINGEGRRQGKRMYNQYGHTGGI